MSSQKKLRRAMNKHLTLDIKKFLKAAGELGPARKRLKVLPYEPAVVTLWVRIIYAWSILVAPVLARDGKLLRHIEYHYNNSKGLEPQKWAYYEVPAGAVTFHCRVLRTDAKLIHIQVGNDWVQESVALKSFGDTIRILYMSGKVVEI